MKNCLSLLLVLIAAFTAQAIPALLPRPDLTWNTVGVGPRNSAAVFCVFIDSNGLAWTGTNAGLYFYDGIACHPMGASVLDGAQVYAIVEKDSKLYIGTNNGLFVYDYADGSFVRRDDDVPNEIRCMLAVGDDLWIGSLYGLWILPLDGDGNRARELTGGLPHNSVYSLMRDARGVIYAGTYDGPARFDSAAGNFEALLPEAGILPPGNMFVNCMIQTPDRRSILMGTENGMYRYTPASDSWQREGAGRGQTVKSMAYTRDGNLLLGTHDGVLEIEGDKIRRHRFDTRKSGTIGDNEIWCLVADSAHNVWAGHERGFSIASSSGILRQIHLSALATSGEGNRIYSIMRSRNGELWLGGTNGAIRIASDGRTDWYRHNERAGSISHNRIRAIVPASGNSVWLATDAGVNRYDGNGSFSTFHIADSAGSNASNWVYALAEDSASLWVASFLSGIHKIGKDRLGGPGGNVGSDLTLNCRRPFANNVWLTNDLINNAILDHSGNLWILLYRDRYLNRYNTADGTLDRFDILEICGKYPVQIAADTSGRIWCAVYGGVLVLDADGSARRVDFPAVGSDESVLALAPVGNDMWVSTQSNVWKVDGHSLLPTALPLPQSAYTAIYRDSASGNVLLGATDRIHVFNPDSAHRASGFRDIKFAMADLDSGTVPLSAVDRARHGIELPYGGSLNLTVSSLDYRPWAVHRFMYKLADSPADTLASWILLPEGANTITLSDLTMGRHRLLVQSVGGTGVPLCIPVTVGRPALLSWYAIALYIIAAAAVITLIVMYMRRRHRCQLYERERLKALENAERKLSFLSDISHDLKTPLSMIIGPVSRLKENAEDPEIRERLQKVYDNAVKLNNMIHRTLEIRQLEEDDDAMLITSTFDVVAFCRTVFDAFRDNNPGKNFVFHCDCDRLLIEADAVKLESVVTNLLSNACKYSGADATVSMGISPRGDNVEIVVSDNGTGIDPSEQALVFERLYRAPATAAAKEGTGLGLYLIKKYLHLMGGSIDLYSRPGQGTALTVLLPLSDGAVVTPSGGTTGNASAERILVVEDNADIRRFLEELFAADYCCLAAPDGSAALAIAPSFRPDLIVADQMMPLMTGLEMCRRLRANPRLAAVPVIMLTAKSDVATQAESIAAGIEVFMEKPFEPAILLARVAQLLRGRRDLRRKERARAIADAAGQPVEAQSADEKTLARIAEAIENNIADPDLNVNMLCKLTGIPNKSLYRLITRYMDTAPLDYIRNVRLRKAAALLAQRRFTVAEVAYMVGFKTPSYFAKCFQSQFGVRPSQYRSDDTLPEPSEA